MKLYLKAGLAVCATVVVVATTSCSQPEFANDQEKFEAYLKTKRVAVDDTDRVERLRADFERRASLASAIYDNGDLDTAVLDAEIEEFRKELLISRYFEQYLDAAVTEQGIQNYYTENINQYKSRKVKVSHILFRTNPRMDESERQVVLSKAAEAHSRIAAGEAFDVVAKEVSEDAISASKGGDLGWLNEGAVSPGFSEKVFRMQAGELSEPFQTDFGFHVIKITEPPQEVTRALETLKGDIRYQLRNKTKRAEMERLLKLSGYQSKQAN
ncbi:peptidylprolyl isomerase [Arenicella xantha]|uniref:peptidylprolyl isomerase n=1 Tax=Arenicella xantha TaxID=644221 RepID=A0A395JFH9_9GAMM|nr:peptidylprolyl isomerase [Arenicella xantha]RBP48520.1 peptidyl-prolyl cis-trans isomerase C [Arenicella xantha]